MVKRTITKIKNWYQDESKRNKGLFSAVVAVLILVLGYGGLSLYAGRNTGYGYGYNYAGSYGYGYQKYNPSPVGGTHPNGTLIKVADNAAVYLLEAGEKRKVKSDWVFRSHGFIWDRIITVSSSEMNSYNTASELNFREGALVKVTDDAKTYIATADGQKRWITTSTVFKDMGFTYDSIRTVSSTELAYLTDGSNISSSATNPNGSLVKTSADTKVYLLENGSKRWVKNSDVFYSHGYRWKDVATLADLSGYANGSDLNFRKGALVRATDNAATYIIDELEDSYQKRNFPTSTLFENLGYKYADVVWTATGNISGIQGGTNVQ